MAGKKYRPALFELIGKGRLKPNRTCSMTTPKWFYSGRRGTTVEPLRREPKVVRQQEGDFPVKAAAQPEVIEPEETEPTIESSFGLHLVDKKLAVWAPYWAVAVAILGLILSLLVAFWLGQTSVAASEPGAGEATVSVPSGSKLPEEAALEGGFQPQNLAADNSEKTPGINQKAALTNTVGGNETSPPERTAGQGKNCLILCSSPQERQLRSVQTYFSTKGVFTRIGKFGGRYVLYCDEGTDSTGSVAAQKFRNNIVELGKRYNSEKPRTAPSFLPSTFDSAYWVLRENISKLQQ